MTDSNLLEELKRLIEASHNSPEDDQLQETTIQKCFDYIAAFPTEKHLFCDPDGYHAGIHALILFSFPDSDALTWYKQKIDHYLSTCQKCIFMFNQGKSKLREKFLISRGLDFESVTKFTEMIATWESSRISPILKQTSQSIQAGGGSVDNSSLILNNRVMITLIECLCGPQMFRINSDLREAFKAVFSYLLDSKVPFKLSNKLAPGVIYLLFEGTNQERQWALSCVSGLNKLEPNDFNASLEEEYEKYIYRIQDPTFYNDDTCSLFWKNIIPLINVCTKETFIEKLQNPTNMPHVQKYFSFKLVSLAQIITNQIMSYQKTSLPFILRAFNAILVKLGSSFWGLVSPLMFNNYLDTIFGNPFYLKYIMELNNNDETSLCLNDLFYWINGMFNSLTNAQKQQAGARIADWFLKLATDREISIPPFTKSLLVTIACDLLTKCLDLEVPLYDINFTVDLLVRVEARNLVDKHADLFVNISFDSTRIDQSSIGVPDENNHEFLRSSCIKLISRCVQFDILNYSQNSFNTYKKNNSSLAPFSATLWTKMLTKSFKSTRLLTKNDNNSFLMISLLSALKGIPGILVVKNDQKHAAQYSMILKYLNSLLSMFLEVEPSGIRIVLSNPNALDGLWSCILSPEQEISQSATSILYEAYDSTGRFEGIQAILKENFEYCLTSLTGSLARTIVCGFYEPCPRAVRVLMDVVNAANDPIDGVLTNDTKYNSISNKEFLQKFWNQCWDFLVFIYKETLQWATAYPAKQLVEFTRDTLDLSHLMLNCFKSVTVVLSTIESRSKIEKELFQKILDSFKPMLVWLRLSDSALLTLCVDLIFKTMDLAGELNLIFNDEVIELLAKYGSKAKKFNNKLTIGQITEILGRARTFNEELVERTILDSEEYRKNNKPNLLAPSTKSSASPPVAARINRPESAPPQKELSKLEKIKMDLRMNRKSNVKTTVIHPPSKPGFHSKRSKKTVSESDDSSGSDSDTAEGARELFMKHKKEKARTSLLDKVNQSKNASLKRPGMNLMDEQKRKEINMRKRLNVSMNPFYQKVLTWSYNNESEYPDDASTQCAAVKDSFENTTQYQKIFEPLLLLECWQSIRQSRELSQEKPFEIIIGTRSSVDNFFDVYASVKKSVLQETKIGEADLLVIAYIDDTSNLSASSITYSKVNCLAKVREIKSANSEFSDITLRILPGSNPMVPLLTPQTSLVAMKVTLMTTIEREYSSLFGLPYYDLVKNIIEARPSYHTTTDDATLNQLLTTFNVNKSQAAAIYGSVHNKGFSLIQGPPGTGKTKTILGIVGYLLTANGAQNAIKVPESKKLSGQKKQKVLICAPSNAAVDELVLRLRNTMSGFDGSPFTPNVVRLGRSDAINAAVKDLTLEELVDKELGNKEEVGVISDSSIRQQHNQCLEERDRVREQLKSDTLPDDQAIQLQLKLREILKRKNDLGRKLDEQREKMSISYRNKEIDKRNIQYRILSDADIICSTLSGSAHDIVKGMNIICDTVIIDEACQCTELSAIIPLRYGSEKCIMVGDPNQLPPTVLSQVASSYSYDQSLFVRMQRRFPNSVYLLNVQYRMHPDISRFPSKEFYESRLVDGDNMKSLTARKWHAVPPFSPYRFFDIHGRQQQSSQSKSYFNMNEVQVALDLVRKLEAIGLENRIPMEGKIGIISPYKEQIFKLKNVFVKHFGKPILNVIDFNTVDGFQGQEKEIIIMSCVRADSNSGVGFLADVRRMNVALTRAKTTLWILGNRKSLEQNKVWKDLIADADSRSCLTPAYPGFLKNNNFNYAKNSSSIYESKEHSETQSVVAEQKVENIKTYQQKEQTNEQNPKKQRQKGEKSKKKQGKSKKKAKLPKEQRDIEGDSNIAMMNSQVAIAISKAKKSSPSVEKTPEVTSTNVSAPLENKNVSENKTPPAGSPSDLKRKPSSSLMKPSGAKSQKSNMFAFKNLNQPPRIMPTIYSLGQPVAAPELPVPKKSGTVSVSLPSKPSGRVSASAISIPSNRDRIKARSQKNKHPQKAPQVSGKPAFETGLMTNTLKNGDTMYGLVQGLYPSISNNFQKNPAEFQNTLANVSTSLPNYAPPQGNANYNKNFNNNQTQNDNNNNNNQNHRYNNYNNYSNYNDGRNTYYGNLHNQSGNNYNSSYNNHQNTYQSSNVWVNPNTRKPNNKSKSSYKNWKNS